MNVNTSTTPTSKGKEDFSYEILEECGIISTNGRYIKKLRYISYNGKDPKYDIRDWKQNGDGTETMCKGITLTGEELLKLVDIVSN